MYNISNQNVKDMFSKVISKVDEREVTRCLSDNSLYLVKITPGSEDYVDGTVYQSYHIALYKSDKSPAAYDNEFFEYSFKVYMMDDNVTTLGFDFEATEKYRQDMDKIIYLYNYNIDKFNSLMMRVIEKIYNLITSDVQKKSEDYYGYLIGQLD